MQYDHIVMHTSTPSFVSDARVAERLKGENPERPVGMVGAHVGGASGGVAPRRARRRLGRRGRVRLRVRRGLGGAAARRRPGIAYRDGDRIRFTPPRPPIEDMDALPFVVDVYRRDLTIENYFIGYLLHPYVSLYTGRGCRSKCTFCLWPQTVGGHRYRVRSAENVEAEMARAKRYFPQVREFFFDDDTFTDDLPRAEEIARRLGRLGITWSCNAKANVPRRTLEVLRDNGLRLLLVGYESGDQRILNNIKKGVRLDVAREFTRHAKALGITIHGTFILGLPGETPATIQETIRYACEIEPDTIQVSLAAPYPGTELYRQAAGTGVAAEGLGRVGERERRPAGGSGLSGSGAVGDLRLRRSVLPAVLFPSPQDRSRWSAACCGTPRSCGGASERASSSSGSCASGGEASRTGARPPPARVAERRPACASCSCVAATSAGAGSGNRSSRS